MNVTAQYGVFLEELIVVQLMKKSSLVMESRCSSS
jgi:hypothetical protein